MFNVLSNLAKTASRVKRAPSPKRIQNQATMLQKRGFPIPPPKTILAKNQNRSRWLVVVERVFPHQRAPPSGGLRLLPCSAKIEGPSRPAAARLPRLPKLAAAAIPPAAARA